MAKFLITGIKVKLNITKLYSKTVPWSQNLNSITSHKSIVIYTIFYIYVFIFLYSIKCPDKGIL